MIVTLVTDVVSTSTLQNGQQQLVLNGSEMQFLHEALTEALSIDIIEARTYFLDTEGYMGTDEQCITHWVTTHD